MTEKIIREINRLQYKQDIAKYPSQKNSAKKQAEELEYQLYLVQHGHSVHFPDCR